LAGFEAGLLAGMMAGIVGIETSMKGTGTSPVAQPPTASAAANAAARQVFTVTRNPTTFTAAP
jgi:hypothetical protein